MIERLRAQAVAALQSEAYHCEGDCGLEEAECLQRHPLIVTAFHMEKPLTVDADVNALVGIVFAAIGLACDGEGKHVYLSTSCLHDDHEYCQSNTGLCGAKNPSQCKFCGTPCICSCH